VQGHLLEELTQPEKQVSEFSPIMNLVKFEILNS